MNFVVKFVKRGIKSYKISKAIRFKSMLKRPGADFNETSISIDDLAFLQYTGATTGLSKGSMLSHGNVVANLGKVRCAISRCVR
ncbi:MAG: hypothetical protein Ct9H300mP6_08630 [Gammaproteobacteria bacterium]|nr:MAG: hypothetical protein Ct9H300mP6_08630 [Gammaproteobacteria bacterium]